MTNKKIIGSFGENIASDYLRRNDYRIVHKNIKISYQEIDIIAFKNNKIIFIEVKTRTNEFFGCAEESINKTKIKNIKKAIMNYSYKNFVALDNTQFDVIVVYINKKTKIANIKHYINLF